jgi:hypothetical protein
MTNAMCRGIGPALSTAKHPGLRRSMAWSRNQFADEENGMVAGLVRLARVALRWTGDS